MKVAAVNTRLDTYMHHLSESARGMWKGRLMAIIDQPNGFFCVQRCADANILPFYFHVPFLPHNAIDLLKSSAQAPTASPTSPIALAFSSTTLILPNSRS